MTDDRYLWWKSEIAKARSDNDMKKLYALQLDYNLELGECLAHQSQRTKDIREDLGDLKTDLCAVTKSVGELDSRMVTLESALVRTADNVSILAKSVQDLVEYRNGISLRAEGAKEAGNMVKVIACGVAIVVGWAYAIYQAWQSFAGK